VDCILSSHQNFVDEFRRMGLHSELMLPCVDPEMVAACLAGEPVRDQDVTFYGTLSTSLFTKRLQFLSDVTRFVRCHVYSEGLSWQRRPRPLGLFLRQLRYVLFWVRTRFEPPVYGQDLLRLIARSKIVLNAHVDSAEGLAGNIRMFETTAMGAMLITDASPNIGQIFEPGREIVTYENAANAVEKLRYYLAHPAEREAIAQAGQRKALSRYSTRVRAQEVLETFENLAVAHGSHGS
jgi:glycosyltransferase involved in cell wall biosynthesis